MLCVCKCSPRGFTARWDDSHASIFKQLPLYQFVFTVDQDSTEKTHKVFVETPMPWTLDLGAAFPTAEEAQKAAESASVEAQGSEVKEEEVDKEPSAAASAASGSEVPEAAVESQEKKEEQMIDTGDGNKVDRSKLEQDIQKAVRSGIELAKKELKSGSK
uniref:Uncharacterized protein n=1 Tax=Palpitomonas bilix TaxID=652834 RepID=A0A7S3DCP6_9EUKA|mmetsp:Transcript_31793/g.82985  ORF Transcript_31793/g.82985 Transcript_31793/m.82985 type:complete len:160 (+) Transcript_31793:757-1236(+)